MAGADRKTICPVFLIIRKLRCTLCPFCNSADPNIDFWNFIPGRIVNNPSLRQAEYFLEHFDSVGSPFAINAICRYFRNQWVSACNNINLFLHLADFAARASNGQISARPGRWNSWNFFRSVDENAVAIEIAKNFNGAVTIFSQCLGFPLAHPGWAGNPFSITILCKKRLDNIWAGKIIGKNGIYRTGNTVKNIASCYPFLVICSRTCNREIFSFVSVPFRIDTV